MGLNMIDCLLLNVQRATVQLYSRREQVQEYHNYIEMRDNDF
jgi:hypothetical protein